ncbi:ATP-binding protein [Candidatus Saccharibacteria bacterium]|nr:ATP-binding protein [Candidatus Saccharibacteria bacterium]
MGTVVTATLPIPMIVITGSSCAGKTSVIDILRENLSDKVEFVPEAASQVLAENIVPKPDILPYFSDCKEIKQSIHYEWLHYLQDSILKRIIELEHIAQQHACEHGKKLIVTDRGIVDMPAYHPKGEVGWEILTTTRVNHLTKTSALSRYHGVIVLETLAIHYPELFSNAINAERYETPEEAAGLHNKITQAWSEHSNYQMVCNLGRSLEEVGSIVESIISSALEKVS